MACGPVPAILPVDGRAGVRGELRLLPQGGSVARMADLAAALVAVAWCAGWMQLFACRRCALGGSWK
jgi:hypothetical protein